MFYEKIIEYCAKNNISVSEFETKCGFGNGTVGKWRDGKYNPRIETLQKIAEVTKTDIKDWL